MRQVTSNHHEFDKRGAIAVGMCRQQINTVKWPNDDEFTRLCLNFHDSDRALRQNASCTARLPTRLCGGGGGRRISAGDDPTKRAPATYPTSRVPPHVDVGRCQRSLSESELPLDCWESSSVEESSSSSWAEGLLHSSSTISVDIAAILPGNTGANRPR